MTTTEHVPDFALDHCDWLSRFAPRDEASRRSLMVKRGIDLLFVTLLAPVAVVVVVCLAVAIRLTSPGAPGLYSQLRTGQGGIRFRIRKLRTMVPGSDRMKRGLADENAREWPDFKLVDDPRITRLGKLLRKTHLDELPQLWNVFTGEMTLVGPRPTSFAAEDYDDWQMRRLEGKPGLTGLWQITHAKSPSFDERVLLDIEYLERRCIRLDLWILALTIPHVLSGRGDR